MFAGLSNIAGLMKQAKEMQGKFKEAQEAIVRSRHEAQSGAGAVTAVVNGRIELIDLRISPDLVKSGDVEMLEDLVKSAVAAAQGKAVEWAKAEMQKVTGGLNLPGLEGLMGQ